MTQWSTEKKLKNYVDDFLATSLCCWLKKTRSGYLTVCLLVRAWSLTDFNSLEVKPEHGRFFKHSDFYSSLKGRNISKEEYENVKRFFTVLRLKTLGDLNRIYNFQDTAILCEIFEERATLLQRLFKFNARKCNSASSFSGCVQRLKSKCYIALPTNTKIVRVYESTAIGGYNCVNIRMTFNTDL